ncbi:anti-sigma factor RsbA family regulatory protein [Mycobacterium sp.]|uniref:anti-sigma factor RsbA family regulatory protein n=1 Tax=Mycobacterium sp. TaxID=1785 RepID=UPI003C70ED62
MTYAQRGHEAFFYRTQQQYRDYLLAFVAGALQADEAVLVAVPDCNLAVLAEGLDGSAANVAMTDMTEAGRNPSRILGEVLSKLVDQHRPKPVRMISEHMWPSRSDIEYPACVEHEALLNRAFNGQDVTVVCPYDVSQLDAGVIADARRTHPVLWQDGVLDHDNAAYAPDAMLARYNRPLPSDPDAVRYTARKLGDLGGARSFAGAYAQWFGLSPDQTADLQLIASELTTASLTQVGRACRLALWRQDGHVICEARDDGCLDDPLAGRRSYGSDSDRGRGLYVVNALADLVRTHTTADETTIQAFLRLPEGP